MVVTRKAPAAPAAGRAGSTSAARPVKTRATAAEVDPVPLHVLDDTAADGKQDVSGTPKKGKQKGKGKQKKGGGKNGRRESLGLVDLLARGLLLWFTIYTLSICPEDDHLKSPVCRGLYHYRRFILEPYIYPPVKAAFAHPAVAPYVDAVKPHYNQFVASTKPIAMRTKTEWDQHVVPQWNKRVVPQWKKRIVPQWKKRAVPQLELLYKQIEPYISRVDEEYQTRIASHVRFALGQLNQFQTAAQPYIILAAHKSHEGYKAAKPYAKPFWEQFKLLIQKLLVFLAVQRRQFVDPHIAQIWDKMTEFSSGKPATKATQSTAAAKARATQASSSIKSISSKIVTSVSSVAVGTASSVVPAVVGLTSPAPSSSSVVNGVISSGSSVASSASSIASSVASLAAESIASKTTSVVAPAASSVSSILSSVAQDASTSVQSTRAKVNAGISSATSTASEVLSSASSIVPAQSQSAKGTVRTAVLAAEDAVEQNPSHAAAAASAARTDVKASASLIASAVSSAAAAASVPTADDDLAAFYEDLGLSEDGIPLEEPAKVPDVEPIPPAPETEEDKAARLAAVAKKREDVVGRHKRWTSDLENAAASQEQKLRTAILRVRTDAAAEFQASSQIDGEIDALVKEAEKLLKGAEGYLNNLVKEKRASKEKASLFVRVADKVDDKFNSRLKQTEEVVNSWYAGVIQKELLEVQEHAKAVTDVADAAQADVGLDYVWLDDVTYHDWQRYHDLARRASNFTEDALMIQNGTHPTSLENPVVSAIQGLEHEVKDVVAGFQTRLRRLRRSGDRTLMGEVPVEDGGVRDDAKEPMVSILPVPGEPEVLSDIPQVVIGRGKDEILEALGHVEASEATETLACQPDDATKAPEELVGELTDQAVAEAAGVGAVRIDL